MMMMMMMMIYDLCLEPKVSSFCFCLFSTGRLQSEASDGKVDSPDEAVFHPGLTYERPRSRYSPQVGAEYAGEHK